MLFLSVPVAAWLDRLTIGQLLAVALRTGTASVFFQTAYQVYLLSLLDHEEMAEGNAKVQATQAAAQVGGPGTAGLITQLAGAGGEDEAGVPGDSRLVLTPPSRLPTAKFIGRSLLLLEF